ncbi:MAG: hypothetical protein ABIU29_06760 [Chthoniobacterales bacterium]
MSLAVVGGTDPPLPNNPSEIAAQRWLEIGARSHWESRIKGLA